MKQTDPFSAIHIAEPCRKNWNNMQPDAMGRFCSSCSKTVIDFSQMKEEDLIRYFSGQNANGICGRFRPGQLKSPDSALSKKIRPTYVLRYLLIWLVAFFSARTSVAQQRDTVLHTGTKEPPYSVKTLKNDSVVYLFKGTIRNAKTGQPLGFATLTVHRESTDRVFVGYTDAEGNYRLEVPAGRGEEALRLVITKRRFRDTVVYDYKPGSDNQDFDLKPHTGKYYWHNGWIHKRRDHHVMGRMVMGCPSF